MIDISNMNKAKVLAALYNSARPQGLGFLHYTPAPMTEQEAAELQPEANYFDYLKGRDMKVDLRSDKFDPYLYDRDNGQGAANRALKSISP